jgi:hypothetical protein
VRILNVDEQAWRNMRRHQIFPLRPSSRNPAEGQGKQIVNKKQCFPVFAFISGSRKRHRHSEFVTR